MNKLLGPLLYIFISVYSMVAIAQPTATSVELMWKGILSDQPSENILIKYLYFTGAVIDPSSTLPYYAESFQINENTIEFKCELKNIQYQVCSEQETELLNSLNFHSENILITQEIYYDRRQPVLSLKFIPIRKNPVTGLFEKVVSFELIINPINPGQTAALKESRNFTDHSVLSSGSWYKFRVRDNGIHRITYNDMLSYGIDATSINPDDIRIYGNAGGMLPEQNSSFRYDDLQENPIYVNDGGDGSFDSGDYLLFYGMSTHTWKPLSTLYVYQVNYYDDYNYYFLTADHGPGKRIEMDGSPTGTITSTISTFNDYQIIEQETHNLIESGKEWYGDEFGETPSRSYPFHFPNIAPNEDISIRVAVANRTFINDLMVIGINNEYTDTVKLTSISVSSTKYAQVKKRTKTYNDLGQNINVSIDYHQAEPGSRMWLNYISINTRSFINLGAGQLQFRDRSSLGPMTITEFTIDQAAPETRVWDITNPIAPFELEVSHTGNQASITATTDSLKEFIAFDGSVYQSPEFVSEVINQDLHGSGPYDLVIVTHPLFYSQAEQLAQLHTEMDNFNVLTVTPETIYNEFSSGKQDPTAIRDLLKLYYTIYEGAEPRYLMLLGDGSFDPKDRIEENTNFVPTFQTAQSWISATSYVVDDYFGLLDDAEGADASGYLDVGIGRIPVQTEEEAQNVVDKIMRYLKPEEPQFGPWRTRLCMIADDEDGNLHLEQADSLSSPSGYVTNDYNQNKIYLDAFPQVKTPSGDKYPEVSSRIEKQMEEGALIMNYIGHGGTGGWAHERILQQNDMTNWSNANKLPAFITATCEFSRFDEPGIVSGGELVLLNPNGGGIALFTTTRLAYSQSNFKLNQRIYTRAFSPVNGEMPYLGDLIRESKPPGQPTTRNFVLLGDPAMKLSYPKHKVITTSFNGNATDGSVTDTIGALKEVTITGEIADFDGNLIQDFNGKVFPVLYDKPTKYKTIGNDQYSYPVDFYNQDKIIWQGTASVIDGKFSFTFVVPLDMAYNFGSAKISYYAFSDTEDASGYYNDFILGGITEDTETDEIGPEISLFINDTTFVSGGLTHPNPVLLAWLSDKHGINQSQSGIGHDITLVLDNDYTNVVTMNSYFTADKDDFRKGYIEFPFHNLEGGTHTLTLKAWDSYNNSSTASIEFTINTDADLSVWNVLNYPNPFTAQTTFTIQHNKPGTDLEIELVIYDLTGRYILSYNTSVYSGSSAVIPFLTWDGRDVNGARLKRGIYVYTVLVSDGTSQESVTRQKLILGH